MAVKEPQAQGEKILSMPPRCPTGANNGDQDGEEGRDAVLQHERRECGCRHSPR